MSNYQYRDHRDRYPDIKRRRVLVMIVDGTVQIYEPALEVTPNEPEGESEPASKQAATPAPAPNVALQTP